MQKDILTVNLLPYIDYIFTHTTFLVSYIESHLFLPPICEVSFYIEAFYMEGWVDFKSLNFLVILSCTLAT